MRQETNEMRMNAMPARTPALPGLGRLAAALCLTLLAAGTARAAPVVTDHVTADLVTRTTSIQPGQPFTVGVDLKVQPHWHVYWVNAGDAGLATSIAWKLPPGFTAGPIQWPYPHKILASGSTNYGYEDHVMLPVSIAAPASLPAGTPAQLSAHVSWLVCADICVPGEATVSTPVDVATATPVADPAWAATFAATEAELPRAPADWRFSATATADGYQLTATPTRPGVTPPGGEMFFFSSEELVLDNAAAQPVTHPDGTVTATLTRASLATDSALRLRGDWVAANGWQPGLDAARIDLPVQPAPAATAAAAAATPAGAGSATPLSAPLAHAPAAGFASLLATLGLGLLGGMVLNLMPCVFPVLGLKIIGFVNQAGHDRRKVIAHGLAFTAGVLISFWGLAGLLAILRAGGDQLGWGFQLQSASFVFVLAAVMLAFALNMSGAFEFGISATRIGGDLQMKQGLLGTFFTGFLATVVATPCSAPFLAPALGAAVTLPIVESFLVFTAIGLGLSLPYLLLSIFPAAVRVLPRPGRWMETFKQVMAFPLYATVAYLLWVLAGQLSADGFLNAIWGLIAIAMGLWAYGRWTSPGASRFGGLRLAVGLLLLLGTGGLWLGFPRADHGAGASAVTWGVWSPETVAKLQADGRTVYVDFTARWCATCQANRKIVFTSNDILKTFADRRIVTLRADWTSKDPAITAELARHNRSAIPFDIIYKPGNPGPIVLPEILTPGIVLKALG